jgi:voltage-gated potassium channel
MLGDWVTFFLALLLIPVLLIEETSTDLGVVRAATAANAAIWVLFALDYAVDLWHAPDRRAHIASHWADLALIVVSPPLFVPPEAQALRALRALRLFRALAVAGVVAERLGRPLTRSAALALVGLLAATIIAGGLLVIVVEPATFPNVAHGYAWALATLMTAGHADPVPVTAAGRAISTLIVVMGLGTFAALAASIASTRPRP